ADVPGQRKSPWLDRVAPSTGGHVVPGYAAPRPDTSPDAFAAANPRASWPAGPARSPAEPPTLARPRPADRPESARYAASELHWEAGSTPHTCVRICDP